MFRVLCSARRSGCWYRPQHAMLRCDAILLESITECLLFLGRHSFSRF
jgi:hypothetical protein